MKDVAAAKARIHKVTDEAAEHLPLSADGLRLILAGALGVLAPEDAEVTIAADDRDVTLDGQQIKVLGASMLHESIVTMLVDGIFKKGPDTTQKIVCRCGHPKSDHVQGHGGTVGTTCLGKPQLTEGTAPPAVCICRWFSPKKLPDPKKT